MRSTIYLLAFVVALCATGRSAVAQKCNCEPRIKFLDDLFHPLASSSGRNPYEEPIETDRHDFTQSPRTVGRGVVRLEAGYSYFYKDIDEEIEQAHVAPELELRLGLTDDIEFQLRWNYAWEFADHADDLDGAEDLRWSLKLGTTEQEGWMPESALEIRSTAPTGGRAWMTDRVEFGLDYIYSWELCEWAELAGSTGLMTNGLGEFGLQPEPEEEDNFLVWSQSVALGLALNRRSEMYLEYFALISHARAEEFRQHYVNIGLDFLATNDLVFDIRLGKGLSEDADDFFAGIGGARRF